MIRGPKFQRGMLHPIGFWHAGGVSPTVNATANGDTTSWFGTSSVGAEFRSDGGEYEDNNGNGTFSDYIGDWLTTGSAGDVWVEFIKTGGTQTNWDIGSNQKDTLYNLSTTQTFYITSSSGNKSIIGYFKFWDNDARTGSPLQTTTGATWLCVPGQ